jgi:hypothetical protein
MSQNAQRYYIPSVAACMRLTLAALALIASVPATGQPAKKPSARLEGSWSGGGTVSFASASTQRDNWRRTAAYVDKISKGRPTRAHVSPKRGPAVTAASGRASYPCSRPVDPASRWIEDCCHSWSVSHVRAPSSLRSGESNPLIHRQLPSWICRGMVTCHGRATSERDLGDARPLLRSIYLAAEQQPGFRTGILARLTL